MFENIKRKISDKIAENEEKKKEAERIEKEKIEQEKQKLMELSEKELIVELIFSIRNIEKEQKLLTEKVEGLESTMWSIKYTDNDL